MFRIIETMAAIWRDGSISGCKALIQTLLSLMWSQTVDNTKEFTDLLPKTWLLVIKVCSGLKYGLDTGRLIFSVGRRRGSLHWGWDGDGCQFRKLLWLPLMSTPETETPLALDWFCAPPDKWGFNSPPPPPPGLVDHFSRQILRPCLSKSASLALSPWNDWV